MYSTLATGTSTTVPYRYRIADEINNQRKILGLLYAYTMGRHLTTAPNPRVVYVTI